MTFDLEFRIYALTPSRAEELFPQLWQEHAELLTSGGRTVATIAAFEDMPGGRIYPAEAGKNIVPIELTDGRIAYRARWHADIVAAPLPDGVEEITIDQLSALAVVANAE